MTEQNKDQPTPEVAIDPTQEPAAESSQELGQLTVEQELAELVQKLNDAQDNFLRAKAEVENVRRRSIEDVAKAHKFAIEGFAENLLPVMDSLNAALLDTTGDFAKMKEGVELTLKQLQGALEKGRVIEINPAKGDKFDPHQHQAISMIPSEQEPNTIVSVLQRGYMIADRILRPALVTVSQAS